MPNYYEAMSLYEYVQKKDEYRQQKLNKTEWYKKKIFFKRARGGGGGGGLNKESSQDSQ